MNESTSPKNTSRKPIIGATKQEVIAVFEGWERRLSYEQNVDSNAVKFQNSDLIVVVDFDAAGRAEGVSFLTTRPDDPTGRTSYVNQHYDELIAWATGAANVPVKNNRTTQFPVEVYIGKLHE